jgi:CRISPR-associated endonuclease Cas1
MDQQGARRRERSREYGQPLPPLRRRGPVCVAEGFGLAVSVERGRLQVRDGSGRDRRERSFSRVKPALSRLVVIGSAGTLSLAAVRWLHDQGIPLVHLDRDGRLLACSTPAAADALLRRAQAFAVGNRAGVEVARYLLGEKLAGHWQVLRRLLGGAATVRADDTEAAFAEAQTRLAGAASLNELVIAERDAAFAYWQQWAAIELSFRRADEARLPDQWRRFGQRSSPLTSGPRAAVNPANALLNYLYALLEAETRVACLTVGLDPTVGIVHADLRGRDSLALDLMEAVRPHVDGYVLDLLEGRVFRTSDFYETRKGGCRVLAPLSHQLAETTMTWARLIAPVAETVATMLAQSPGAKLDRLPTPLTNSNRHAGRAAMRRRLKPATSTPRPLLPPTCRDCGEPLPSRHRDYCDQCLRQQHARQHAAFQASGLAALAARKKQGDDPTHGGDAAARRGRSIAASKVEIAEWEARYGKLLDPTAFQRDILPRLQGIPLRRLMDATGLSLRYCSQIRRGEKTPHPRHWDALRRLAQGGLAGC